MGETSGTLHINSLMMRLSHQDLENSVVSLIVCFARTLTIEVSRILLNSVFILIFTLTNLLANQPPNEQNTWYTRVILHTLFQPGVRFWWKE